MGFNYTYRDFPEELSRYYTYMSDADVVLQDFKRMMLTEKGDFIDNPDYGLSMERYKYEFMDDDLTEFVDMELREGVAAFMADDIIIQNISATSNVDNYEFAVTVELYLINFDVTRTLTVPYK